MTDAYDRICGNLCFALAREGFRDRTITNKNKTTNLTLSTLQYRPDFSFKLRALRQKTGRMCLSELGCQSLLTVTDGK